MLRHALDIVSGVTTGTENARGEPRADSVASPTAGAVSTHAKWWAYRLVVGLRYMLSLPVLAKGIPL